jgi:hypothetical protein
MTNAPYFIRGANILPSDPKLERWAKRLILFQQGAGTDKKFDYKKSDTGRRILKKLASSIYGGWISVQIGVKFGEGKPSAAPKAPYINRKVYVQTNSVPPWKVWVYQNGEWS